LLAKKKKPVGITTAVKKEETILYDVVHDYIIAEDFASDTEGANKVMLKLSDELMQEIYERTMTASEKRKDTMLKKKYDDSDMKKNMQAQYGKEEGKKVYFATIRKQAMKKEEVEVVDEAMSSYDRNRKAAAKRAAQRNAERRAGTRGGRMERETYRNEAGVQMHHKGYRANANEEVEVVNEVSKKTLGSYVKKAATEIGTSAMKGDYKKMQKRHKGVLDASDKLQKEGAEKSYYIDKEAEKRGMERDARRAQNKAAAKERAAAKRRAERNQLRRQGQYGAQGKYYVTKHMEREEVEYTGPNKEDKKLIKKMDNPSYAKKLANYEKNMDPKKRQELKNKAIKGMKFTHEGTSYGLYKGSGKASGAMKDYLDKKAKMLTKKRNKQSDAAKNNPHFDSTQPSPSGRNKYEEVQRDGYGDPIGGPKISKKQKAKNLASNTPDEQHTTTTSEAVTFQHFMEKCWKGYEKKGMKTMFGKRYPNCVKKEETVIEHHQKDENGKVIEHDLPPRPEEEVAQDLAPSSVEEGAAWTKKSGKNPSGGLNEKGRKSYERDNPGSDLKRPSKKVGNKRRASFCARMRGMKKKLTSAKTARDPDSRINKSLRAWNC